MDLWTQINKTIDETIDNLTVSLIAGQVEDYSNYSKVVGNIKGLQDAKEILRVVVKARTEGDDYDDDY
jgi:hypothetical protein|tara:strand:+ start:6283 stop:6486 length:204 start_codon:yes stop_codon:yes gene_type:complete